MQKSNSTLALVGSMIALTACGGGAGGGAGTLQDFANRYAALGSDPTLNSMSADATVNARNGSASYVGVINIGTSSATNPAGDASYYGNLNMTVNFNSSTTADTVTGSAGNFVQFFSTIASPKTGNGVSGSLTLAGNLTGTNTSLGDGIAGTASGTIDGINVAYDMDGNVTGVGANGLSLFFSGTNPDSSGGVGLAVE